MRARSKPASNVIEFKSPRMPKNYAQQRQSANDAEIEALRLEIRYFEGYLRGLKSRMTMLAKERDLACAYSGDRDR